jgi:hypothetical protein
MMVNNPHQNVNPNRSSNPNHPQHMRQHPQVGNGNHHHHSQQQHQSNRPQHQQAHPQGVNRAVQRPPNQQPNSGAHHHQSSQQHHHHHHNSNSTGAPVNRVSQNGVNPVRPAGAPGQPNSGQNPNRPRPVQQGATGGSATGTNPNPQPPPQILPKGWKREEIVRMRGITAGQVDIVYGPTNPNCEFANQDTIGKKFKTKLELQRIFGDKYDMSLLDFRSGKLSQVALRKQRRNKSLAANPNNYISAAKYDPYLTVPSRQTAGIFKQSVSYVTNNHRSEATPAHILNPSLLLNNPTSTAVQQLTQNQILALSKNLDRVKPTQVRLIVNFFS